MEKFLHEAEEKKSFDFSLENIHRELREHQRSVDVTVQPGSRSIMSSNEFFSGHFNPPRCWCDRLARSFIRLIMRNSPHGNLSQRKSHFSTSTPDMASNILYVGMSWRQTRKLHSFMHVIHSGDKPQHRTNRHSFT